MSLRVLALTFLVLFLSGYAWFRSWFAALCGMIVLMAFLEHRDMPRAIGGITGLNLWNFLYVNVFFAWLQQRSQQGLTWDLPKGTQRAIWLFWLVIVVSATRLLIEPTRFYSDSFTSNVVGHLIDPLKIFLPCLLLYDGCRTRERMRLALGSIVLANVLLAAQAFKYMGVGSLTLSGNALSAKAIRILDSMVGFHRVDLSMIFAGAFWATFAYALSFTERKIRWAIFMLLPVIMLGQAVTGGRTGYATWGLLGAILCILRWRKFLPLIPLGAILVVAVAPGVRERMLMGFGVQTGLNQTSTDLQEVTSGRAAVWPLVIEEIKGSPIIGYGKEAMKRTGLNEWIEDNKGNNPELSGGFGHPHNAYLEWVFDNGLVGFLLGLPIYLLSFRQSFGLFLRGRDSLTVAAGAMALAMLLGLLIAALGSQTFYPRVGCFGLWAAIGIAWRARQMELDAAAGDPFEADEETFLEEYPASVLAGRARSGVLR